MSLVSTLTFNNTCILSLVSTLTFNFPCLGTIDVKKPLFNIVYYAIAFE